MRRVVNKCGKQYELVQPTHLTVKTHHVWRERQMAVTSQYATNFISPGNKVKFKTQVYYFEIFDTELSCLNGGAFEYRIETTMYNRSK